MCSLHAALVSCFSLWHTTAPVYQVPFPQPNQTVRRNENTVTQSRHLIYLRNITRIEAVSAILVQDRTTEWSLEIQKCSAHVSNKLWFDLLMNEKKCLDFYNFTDIIYGVILYQYVNNKSLQTYGDKFWLPVYLNQYATL